MAGPPRLTPALAMSPGPPVGLCRVEQISRLPRAYVYHGFLTPDECAHVVGVSRPLVRAAERAGQPAMPPPSRGCLQMRRSTVVGQGGKSVEDSIRTSYGTFLRSVGLPGRSASAPCACRPTSSSVQAATGPSHHRHRAAPGDLDHAEHQPPGGHAGAPAVVTPMLHASRRGMRASL